jgi:hypothetical protein
VLKYRGSMRAKRAVVVALSSCLSVAAFAEVGAVGEPRAGSSGVELVRQANCEVGGSPTHPYGNRPPEAFLRYGTRPVVIGCAELASGRRFELVGYQLRRGDQGSLCVDHYDFETGVTWGCGSNLVRGGGAIDATSTDRTTGHVPVVAGTTAPSVARVVVRSEVDGRLRRHPAVTVSVRDRELLRKISVRKSFGRYLAEVPQGARGASAEALGARGRTLGLAFFPGFRGPVGEGRRCYSQPRVARLRLLGRARVDETSQVRVVAIYRGGYIGSIDVSVGGRRGPHADLVETNPRRAGGRRVVTLPVRFTRPGVIGLDVTAEGFPLSRRCGDRPPLRHSAPKTLAVQVR